ncbi:Extracellular matrix-binding ebh, putative [Babesia ovata]|uniref:Extracellular matrix-binding ebh, putative n=1 Tax=Babesia ovata TaxID=189622 RepID=A0A2H6KGB8_9APIC|nr:Extracellular matrix-binding ebh, putative [Babesia ovata]GBE62035.1 Extracellular matrix-binding ebh, putative [Babesia ovata]
MLRGVGESERYTECEVTEALEAVVAMDRDLKKDLRIVRDKIKEGIKRIIEDLEVDSLDEKVKSDLQSLKERISDLSQQVTGDGTNQDLVNDAFAALKSARQKFGADTQRITDETNKLEQNFKDHIQSELENKVTEVDSAIGNLGGNFKVRDPKKFKTIFEHIKTKVGEIKGEPGKQSGGRWHNSTGLSAVVDKVKHLAGLFRGQSQFEHKVQGWVENNILKRDPIKSFIEKYVSENHGKFHGNYGMKKNNDAVYTDLNNQITIVFKQQLTSEATAAGVVVEQRMRDADNTPTVRGYVEALKEGCDNFVKGFGEKLKVKYIDQFENECEKLVTAIVKGINDAVKDKSHGSQSPDTDYLKPAVQGALIHLLVMARHTAVELGSFALGDERHRRPPIRNIADNVDSALYVAKDLDRQLTQATKTPKPGTVPPGQSESPAQAVDRTLEAVRDFVEKELGGKFTEVKKPLSDEVEKLGPAVTQFNSAAELQIKDAAKTAIEKAANQIEMESGSKNQVSVEQNMNTFHGAHQNIVNNLQEDLNKEVNKYIGEDDPPTGGQGVTAEKVIITAANFGNYDKHVKQGKINALTPGGTLQGTAEADEGHLQVAIGKIKTLGLAALENTIGDQAGKITDTTFTGPFETINNELEAIRKLFEKGCRSLPEGV